MPIRLSRRNRPDAPGELCLNLALSVSERVDSFDVRHSFDQLTLKPEALLQLRWVSRANLVLNLLDYHFGGFVTATRPGVLQVKPFVRRTRSTR